MNSRLAVAVSTAVIVLLAAGFLTTVQQGANTTTGSQSSTTIGTGGSFVNAQQNLQLRLSVNASSSPTAFRIMVAREHGEFVWDSLRDAGHDLGLTLVGAAARARLNGQA